jgi:transcriptional regulator with XRE-family HTH domain
MTKDEVLKRLDTLCEKAGSMRKFALANGFSAGYVSQVMNGKSPPSKRLLKAMGINPKVSYVKITPKYED